MKNLKEIIFEASSKASLDAIINWFKPSLIAHKCKVIRWTGRVKPSFGFGIIDFEDMNLSFIYKGLSVNVTFSQAGGQFYVSTLGMKNLMYYVTCQSTDAMFKKLDKAAKNK